MHIIKQNTKNIQPNEILTVRGPYSIVRQKFRWAISRQGKIVVHELDLKLASQLTQMFNLEEDLSR